MQNWRAAQPASSQLSRQTDRPQEERLEDDNRLRGCVSACSGSRWYLSTGGLRMGSGEPWVQSCLRELFEAFCWRLHCATLAELSPVAPWHSRHQQGQLLCHLQRGSFLASQGLADHSKALFPPPPPPAMGCQALPWPSLLMNANSILLAEAEPLGLACLRL